jgi:hypothetical protein
MYDKCVESFFGKIFGLKCRYPGAGPGFSDMPRLNHNKMEHVPSMERTALENKVSQNRGECVSRIPSESDVACCHLLLCFHRDLYREYELGTLVGMVCMYPSICI